jgi:hypothetical protein
MARHDVTIASANSPNLAVHGTVISHWLIILMRFHSKVHYMLLDVKAIVESLTLKANPEWPAVMQRRPLLGYLYAG